MRGAPHGAASHRNSPVSTICPEPSGERLPTTVARAGRCGPGARPVALCLSIALGLAACGAPMAGDGCNSQGYLCQDASTALECREGVWTGLPCRGPEGCAHLSIGVTCDTSASMEGDACAASAEARGICTQDGSALLECRRGTFVKTRSCRSCVEESGQLVCRT